MENNQELRNVFKELTKYGNGIFLLLIVVCSYVIQRSYIAIPLAEDVTSEFVDKTMKSTQQPQVVASGLSFTYGAMNIFWPIVIFTLHFSLLILLSKQRDVWGHLQLEANSRLLFDPLNFFFEIQSSKIGSIVIKTVCYLPLFAILLHGFSGYWIYSIISSEQIASIESQEFLIWQFHLQFLTTIFSLLLSTTIPSRLIRIIKTYMR